jgi:photosystem II stability/assembly factor-like uncharacterized protein
MKKIFTLLSLAFVLVVAKDSTAQQTWSIVSAGNSSSDPIYYDVTNSTSNLWHACGDNSKILISDNYGKTWSEADVEGSKTIRFNTIEFSNSLVGFAAGRTTSLQFGNYGKLYFTVDGGKKWEDYGTSSSLPNVNSIFFSSFYRGYAVANNRIMRTTSAGNSWAYIYTYGSIDLYDIHFPDSMYGFACGELGSITRTDDGGKSWQTVYSDPDNEDLFAVHFVNKNLGFACGEYGNLVRTTDGGDTWVKFNNTVPYDLTSISFLNEQQGFIVGENGTILYTSNGGASFNFVTTPTSNALASVKMTATNQAVAVGTRKTILKYGTLGLSNKTISALDENSVRVYPNPALNTVNIELAEGLGEATLVSIYDMTGKLLYTKTHNLSVNKASIDISNFASGVYSVRIETENNTFTQQLIKQ